MNNRKPLLILVLALSGVLSLADAQTAFPGKIWSTRTPAEVGMDSAKLDAFAMRVGGDGVIIKDGFLVKSWGGATVCKDWASAAKPVLSTLLLLAVQEGKLASVDALVKDAGWALAEKDATMTYRHLANMVSGYACVEPPGAAWGYNDYGIQLYARSLERVFGQKLDAAIRERLAPLQFEDGVIFGSRNDLGVIASPRDFARIGWLWLNEGNWNGRPLIAKDLFTDHIKPGVPASLPRTQGKGADYLGIGTYGGGTDQTLHGPGVYGFNFWFNNSVGEPARRAWPALPPDVYQANGMWNRDTVTIMPSLRMVVAVRGAKLGPFEPGREDGAANRNLKLLMDAFGVISEKSRSAGTYFPPPGESLNQQSRKPPAEVGMDDSFIAGMATNVTGRWALWRDGYLIHVQGDFNKKQDVKSLRKTWHALTVGAAIKQGRIPGLDQKVSTWVDGLTGPHADATWWHVLTQTSGLDYPYGEFPAFQPGEMWTYSDKNPRVLCNALARVFGKKDCRDNYADVVKAAYFDAIGMRGWQTVPQDDGVRLVLDLEDMGRLGLLVLNRGQWNGVELIPQWFIEQLERKQTDTIRVNYNGPDDGKIDLDPEKFPEVPYGFMTWVNTDGDFYPGADKAWAWGAGAGGTCIMWNRNNGIVFAAVGVVNQPSTNGIPHVIERAIRTSNPLVADTDARPAITSKSPASAPKTSRPATKELGHIGSFAKWRRVELSLLGPDTKARGEPNPFTVVVEGLFTAPSGKQWKVPGFYDGDGHGGPDGMAWKVRFSADELGEWSFTSQSVDASLHGWTATFTVTAAPADAAGMYRSGRLEVVGTAANQIRYLKCREGPYWLKAGCDDPENFLGKSSNYDTNAKRMAAIDYLAAKGINSLYIMTHNLDGDDKDVWPWLGRTAKEAKANGGANARFDVATLEEWRQLFDHMQAKGVVVYLVLEDDSAWKGYDHARYYREMVARFGYLPALLFNFNEEYNENYTLPEALDFMRQLKDLDPFQHPRGIHNVNAPTDAYISATQVDFTSIQTKGTSPLEHHRMTVDWIQRCRALQHRVLMIGYDEGRPEEDRRAWWSAYLGGGVWEAHVRPPYDRPVSAWETVWTELGGARAFMELLPFWEMEPANDVVENGMAFCLAKRGEVYAFYLPEGGPIEISLPPGGPFTAAWWNPGNGKHGRLQNEQVLSGGRQKLIAPNAGDWAVRVVRHKQEENP